MRKLALLGLAAALAAVAVTAAAAGRAAAPKQPVVAAFYRGQTLESFDFGAVRARPGNKLAPIWRFTNGAPEQHDVVDSIPGQAAYSSLRQVNDVTWSSGVVPRVLRSADEIRAAEAAGELTAKPTSALLNRPVLGFGQKRVEGFSGGRPIHYYDLGPVAIAPGNDVVTLYAPTNGVAGQHNVTADTLARGQTRYPPLWRIVQVTWKPGAARRLLRSFADIRRAQAAGTVTLRRTALVVNCPIVP
jgi:hypothetical protein